MLGVFAQKYVWVGNGPRPWPQFDGKLSPFMPHQEAGKDRHVRSRAAQAVQPRYPKGRQRAFRAGYQSRPAVYQQFFSTVVRGWSDMAEAPRELSSAERNAIRRYQPVRVIDSGHWKAIREFVITVTLEVAPHSKTDPLSYISVIVRYVDWCYRVMGMELEVEEMFDFDMIAYYAMNATHTLSKASKGSIRARLLWVGDQLVDGGVRQRVLEKVGRTPVTEPYTVTEIVLLKKWAASQSTAYARHMCWTALVFGLGAGLTSRELIGLKSEDVTETPDGVLVKVGQSDAPRQVVMLAEWEDYAVVLADCVASDAFIFSSHMTVRESKVVSQSLRRTKNRPDGLRINMEKMRLTWFVRLLNAGCPVPVFLQAAGLKGMSAIERIVPFLDAGPAHQATEALRSFDAQRKAEFRANNSDYCNRLRREREALRKSFAQQVQGR